MDELLDLARSLIGTPWLVLVVFLVTLADCFVPPVPSDELIIAVAALAVASGETWVLLGLFGAGLTGALVGDSLAFVAGGRLPRERLARWPRVARMLAGADAQFARRGARIVVTARFLPIVRVGVTLVAGGSMRYVSWLPLGALACALWAGFTVTIGAVAGFGLSDQPVLAMGIGMVIGLAAGVLVDRWAQRHQGTPAARQG